MIALFVNYEWRYERKRLILILKFEMVQCWTLQVCENSWSYTTTDYDLDATRNDPRPFYKRMFTKEK